MGVVADGAWDDKREDSDDMDPFEEQDEPIGSERRGLDMAAAIAAGDACASCGQAPHFCTCENTGPLDAGSDAADLEKAFAVVLADLDATRDTIETPAPVWNSQAAEDSPTFSTCFSLAKDRS